jgi:hypothetical protein
VQHNKDLREVICTKSPAECAENILDVHRRDPLATAASRIRRILSAPAPTIMPPPMSAADRSAGNNDASP